MLNKPSLIFDFIKNMGLRYILFRVWHTFQVKTGIFKKKFPSAPKAKTFISKKEWKEKNIPFFFDSKYDLQLDKNPSEILESRFRESKKNIITFFSNRKIQLEVDNQWLKNPDSGFIYDAIKHWSQIPDLSTEAGDIKFVWEKARFSFLYDIIRYDYHFESDQAAYVLSEIEDFIDKNPINLGPQYKCSQEISLRILNWTFALHYYKHSEHLTEELFSKVMNAIYWQLHHVYHNINFSRIAVRNNHAITETLTLYLSHLLFPFIPETEAWSKKGKQWFEQEVDYQIYDDGTFLQYSMNYHRVVIQLLTWGIRLADLNNKRFAAFVYDKAQKSLDFLDACLDKCSGTLPNYGSNDGALFFKLTDLDYRNYTSQLDDLRMSLQGTAVAKSESFEWYGLKNASIVERKQKTISNFDIGGYYIINEPDVKTFIRCGAYKDRPAQADNLHLDLWVNGENYLWDSGSYKYNTDLNLIKHFTGTTGHNTVSIDHKDQMLKGGRFIWFKWIKEVQATLKKDQKYIFRGSIDAFRHLGGITHKRVVEKTPGQLCWKIVDTTNKDKFSLMIQHWHMNPKFKDKISFIAKDSNGNELLPKVESNWYSGYYGLKEKSISISFSTPTNLIHTQIIIHT